jgi:hypothetical protein
MIERYPVVGFAVLAMIILSTAFIAVYLLLYNAIFAGIFLIAALALIYYLYRSRRRPAA